MTERDQQAPALSVGASAAPPNDPFSELLQRPYVEHFAALASATDRTQIVSALRPDVLVGLFRSGVALALQQFGHALSPGTSNLVGLWLHEHAKRAERLQDQWEHLAAGTANDFVRGAKSVLLSKEANTGGALGSYIGPWGGVLGQVIGGLVSLGSQEQNFERSYGAYLAEVEAWCAALAQDFDGRVLPRVLRDLNPWPWRIKWALGAALVASAAGAAWFFH